MNAATNQDVDGTIDQLADTVGAEAVVRCVGEQIAVHIVDVAEAYASAGVPDDAEMPDLPDHGHVDLGFDRVREMLDNRATTMLASAGLDVTVNRRAFLRPTCWFVPLSEEEWE